MKINLSEKELKDLILSCICLALIITIAYSVKSKELQLFMFIPALSIGITAFLPHELAHKFVAQKYGHWAEYRAWWEGIAIAFLIALTGVIFIAPGAVYIIPRGIGASREESGKIAAAGPITNLIIASLFVVLMELAHNMLLARFFGLLAYVNAFLAMFNLIPFSPLDGSKIIFWDRGIWLTMLIISILLFIATM